ncbi:MAG: acyl-CoA dehydrogenase family protein [Acidimicrobiales bacterium]|jgi:alkylation response protein AidB-like acyl-CoA dehydrogenase|nr:acyl-CoA dehydrogenase family protein [Acidimicrobiales bacterium]
MDLSLTEDQVAIADVFGTFFAKEAGPTVARHAEPLGFDRALWDRLLETGATGMGLPEAVGGGGAGIADLAVVAEHVGRSIAPVPFVDHAVAGRLLAAVGAPAALLDPVCEGSRIATVALRPPVDGVLRVVPSGAVASVILALDGDRLVAVTADAPGVALRNHGCAPLAHRRLDEGERVVLASGPDAVAAHERAVAEWQVLTAAALLGIAESALAMGVEYVKTREQFGRPIGAFQAVQQGLADLPGLIEGCRLLTGKAAWAADRGTPGVVDPAWNEITDATVLAGMSFVFAADVADRATDRSLHFHGGYGYAEEYDVQLFYRRSRTWALVLDDPAAVCRRLADRMFPEA